MSIETKDTIDSFHEVVALEVKCTYSQQNEIEELKYDKIKVCTASNGDGHYFIIKTDRWAFNDIDELVKVLQDFKEKAKL